MDSLDFEEDRARKSARHERDETVKAKRRQTERGPRADRPNRPGWASALGNAAVQRLLRTVGVGRSASDPVDDSVARAIQAKRGTGQTLDSTTQREMETSFGYDFSGVRVHADAEADSLNRAVEAAAFTTGNDIFFRSGNYDPGSPDGRKLLTHELTHVVQQDGAAPAQDFTVSSPDDAAERQAGEVAEHLGAAPVAAAPALSRQAMPEEEEEEIQKSPAVQRQGAPEDEEEEPPR